jgi:NAD-dependent dihydropyrimidine dehydrogenase PreA subunit
MANPSLSREKIPWFPTINPDLCIGDQDCVNFCKNDVLAFDQDAFKAIVVNPYRCVVGCDACSKICPQEAIRFPNRAELRATLRRLREEVPQVQITPGWPVSARRPASCTGSPGDPATRSPAQSCGD